VLLEAAATPTAEPAPDPAPRDRIQGRRARPALIHRPGKVASGAATRELGATRGGARDTAPYPPARSRLPSLA